MCAWAIGIAGISKLVIGARYAIEHLIEMTG